MIQDDKFASNQPLIPTKGKKKKEKTLSKLGEMGAQRATVVLTNIHTNLVVILGEFGAKRSNFHIS